MVKAKVKVMSNLNGDFEWETRLISSVHVCLMWASIIFTIRHCYYYYGWYFSSGKDLEAVTGGDGGRGLK